MNPHIAAAQGAAGLPNDLPATSETPPAFELPSPDEMGLSSNNTDGSVLVIVMPENNATEGATTYDLGRTVLTSLERNPRLEAAQRGIDAARQGRNSRIGPFLPTVTGSYSYSFTSRPRPLGTPPALSPNLYSLAFNVQQNLFTGGRVFNEFRRSQLTLEQEETNYINEELSLVLTVQENFLNLLGAQENVRSAQDSVTRLRSQLQVTQAFYDVGLRPRLDVLQAEVDLGEAEDALLQAQNDVDTQRARLATLMDMELDAPLVFEGVLRYTPFEIPLEACLTEAYSNRPDLQIFQRAINIARKDSYIAGSVMLPQVAASIDWFQTGSRPNIAGDSILPPQTQLDTYVFSIGLTWEIFDFGENFFSWRQTEELVKQFEADYANQFLEATFDVKSRHLAITETAKRIRVARQSLTAAQEGYRMAVARYQAQVGTSTEVLDAQSRLTDAEARMTQALVDNQVALANLFISLGRKNVTLDVSPTPVAAPKVTINPS